MEIILLEEVRSMIRVRLWWLPITKFNKKFEE